MSETIVVAADLRHVESITAIKEGLSEICRLQKRIILVDERSHRIVAQAYALGATHLLSSIDQHDLFECLDDENEPSSWQIGGGPKEIAAASAALISTMSSAVSDGRRIDVPGTEDAANCIANIVGEDGLSAWIETVRRHHEGTYQHCLLVTGVAADFGLSLGVSGADIKRIASAATFHDTGKGRIPLAVSSRQYVRAPLFNRGRLTKAGGGQI